MEYTRRSAETQGRKTFKFRGKVRHETDEALLIAPVDYHFPKAAAFWLPRSQTHIVEWADEFDQHFIFEVPYQLAVEVFVS
jgi:hypothetical protein